MTCRDCKKLVDDYDLCDPCINRKHVALRGSSALLYTQGTPEPTCEQRCVDGQHRCYFALNHEANHKFSSECEGL